MYPMAEGTKRNATISARKKATAVHLNALTWLRRLAAFNSWWFDGQDGLASWLLFALLSSPLGTSIVVGGFFFLSDSSFCHLRIDGWIICSSSFSVSSNKQFRRVVLSYNWSMERGLRVMGESLLARIQWYIAALSYVCPSGSMTGSVNVLLSSNTS